ncbi:MAG: lysophospholipid acyltransferase family protein, partial [Rhodospirillaceae bacterium]|nr:lysophospholipid acyltransferase family protein [Rhodospirillaceae bacterium]
NTSALVYRAPNNPLVESLLRSTRGHAQTTLIPKGAGGARTIMRILKGGGFVQMAVDQKMNTGLPISFMGRPAMTGDAVARLALRYGCALIPAYSERLDGCRFRVTIEPPWTPEDTGDRDADVRSALERVNRTMEAWIKRTPGQWLWLHNRWPKDETKA